MVTDDPYKPPKNSIGLNSKKESKRYWGTRLSLIVIAIIFYILIGLNLIYWNPNPKDLMSYVGMVGLAIVGVSLIWLAIKGSNKAINIAKYGIPIIGAGGCEIS